MDNFYILDRLAAVHINFDLKLNVQSLSKATFFRYGRINNRFSCLHSFQGGYLSGKALKSKTLGSS